MRIALESAFCRLYDGYCRLVAIVGFCASILKLDMPVLVSVHISMSGKPSHLFMVCFFDRGAPNAFLSTTYLWYVCSRCVSVDRVFVSSPRSTK